MAGQTYAKIYEAYQKERQTPELAKHEEEPYALVEKTLQETKITDENEREIRNLLSLRHKIYNLRETKIIHIAQAKSRTNCFMIDTSALMDHEHALLNRFESTLRELRKQKLGDYDNV